MAILNLDSLITTSEARDMGSGPFFARTFSVVIDRDVAFALSATHDQHLICVYWGTDVSGSFHSYMNLGPDTLAVDYVRAFGALNTI